MPLNQLRSLGVALLVALGLASSLAQLTEASWLATFAQATVASPLPRAFSQSQSLAGFANELTIELTTADGTVERRTESSELFAGLPGPYERRVIYGAALSFAPTSPRPPLTTILRYGFCRSGPLAARMGVRQPLRSVALIGSAPLARSSPMGSVRRVVVDCATDAGAR